MHGSAGSLVRALTPNSEYIYTMGPWATPTPLTGSIIQVGIQEFYSGPVSVPRVY